jgi:hypothetical protein
MPMKPPPPAPAGQPDDLWERLCAMPRPNKPVDFPKFDPVTGKAYGQIRMWILRQDEIETAAATAGQRARRALAKIITDQQSKEVAGTPLGDAIDRVTYEELYSNIRACELLFRACRKMGDVNQPAFPSVDHMRAQLTSDEVGTLMSYYYTVQSELGPISASMTEADVDAWIERLAKSGERYPLGSLSQDALQKLTFSLAHRLSSSATATSSAGSPLESGTESGAKSDPSESEPSSDSDDVAPSE